MGNSSSHDLSRQQSATCQISTETEFVPRILLVGPTGVGKSTLINAILGLQGHQRAETRAGGAPCTNLFSEYGPSTSAPLKLIDSRGIERDSTNQRETILRFITSQNRLGNTIRRINIVWYMPGMRWEISDSKFLRCLQELVRTVVVLTKSDLRGDMDPLSGKSSLELTKQVIREESPNVEIIECAAPLEGSQQWVPHACPAGHGREEFIILSKQKIWVCKKMILGSRCGAYGEAQDYDCGITKLINHALHR